VVFKNMKRIRNEIASKKLEAQVPDLVFTEIANVLRYSNLSENGVDLRTKSLNENGLISYRSEELIYDAIKISLENNIQ